MEYSDGVWDNCRRFLETHKTLALATLDEAGAPCISYAPFLLHDGVFYIFISQLAAHTRHLQHQHLASVMVMADEGETRNLFACQRFSQAVVAEAVADNSLAELVLDNMQEVLGKTLGLLRGLSDFGLYRLVPQGNGRYVAGFGKAFDVSLSAKAVIAQVTSDKQA